MTAFDSTPGGGGAVADELAAEQRSISIAEFFEKNKHMLGFDSEARALVTATKEGVDNSLTWSTPFVYRENGETKHRAIGETIDELIEENPDEVKRKRGGNLEKLPVQNLESLSFDDSYDLDFRRISSVFRHRVNSDIFELTLEGNRTVELTDYHSVFVLREGSIVSVETSDIEEDDYVVVPDAAWGEGGKAEIDLVSELFKLPSERTEPLGLYGIDHLLEAYEAEIRNQIDRSYRFSDFRKCDRLPFEIVQELDLDSAEYDGCEIGYRFGKNRIPAVLPVTPELGEFLGVYMAEGSYTGTRSDHDKVYLSLGAHETELIDYVQKLVSEVFDLTATVADAHETARNVTISSKVLGLVLSEVFAVGETAAEKRIPRFVFDFPGSVRERFILGYGAGDGYPTSDIIEALRSNEKIEDLEPYRITFSTASKPLASGISYLCSSIGYDVTREINEEEIREVDGNRTEFGESYLLHLHTDQSKISKRRLPANEILESVTDSKLAYNLDGRQDRVNTEHALALADGGKVEFANNGAAIATGDLTALPVKRIETIDYTKEWVYDVSVPGDENFMAGTSPIACHNSLDAAEEAGYLPDIYVEITEVGDHYRLIIEDNGPGITAEELPKVFGKLLYGSRFHKREQSLTPDQEILIRRNGTVETTPIGRLCDAYLPTDGEATREIPDSIEAPSFDRETREVTWQPITHAIRHETEAETYQITTEKGRSVTVTGNHSLFGLDSTGSVAELNAADLEPGDAVLAPKDLPATERSIESINLLDYLQPSQLTDRRVYVYGFDDETLEKLRTGDVVRKKPNSDSSRKRYYYRYDGVDILRDSLEQNYLEKGYLPAETVLELGWEDKAADCTFKTYRVGGDETTMPVSIPVDESVVKLLAYYISEGHVGPRQVGFTFGSHESTLIEATERAVQTITGSATTVQRERNSTRVKAFGSPLSMFLEATCGSSAAEKQIPAFVFDLEPTLQRRFIAALYEGDGSDSHPSNELSHTTTSQTLARQLSLLWNMQGVMASVERGQSSGYSDEPSERFRTKVYGEDVSVLEAFDAADNPGEQRYERVPVSVLDDVSVADTSYTTVPDTIPGLLAAAGVGSNFEYAKEYQSVIEDAISGERVDEPYYAHNLEEMGLLDDGRATDRLEELWDAVQSVHGFTEGDMRLLRVKSVEPTEPPEYVYDISVPGQTGHDENFVVANDGAVAVKNSRGQQGIGISAAVLYSQLTSGKPAKITSRTEGQAEARYFELVIDTDDNEPEIRKEERTTWDRSHGTRIELDMEANMRARSQLHDYIRHTAVVNPHARIELREPNAHIKSERAEGATLPAETEEIRPHPHGVEVGTLLKMLADTDSRTLRGFLQTAFTRVGQKTADGIIAAFRDREYGRQFRWHPPQDHEDVNLARSVAEAVTNKGRDLERQFGDRLDELVREAAPISDAELESIVESLADDLAEESGRAFGRTVREKVHAAAWSAITNDRRGALYRTIDDVTTTRKDDAAIDALAERLAERIADTDHDQFTRAALATAVDRAADLTEEMDDATFGETARENVVEALWADMARIEVDVPSPTTIADDRDAAGNLLAGMASMDVMAPPSSCLSPITEEQIEAGLQSEFDADFYTAATRDAEVHSGDPFIAEAGIAYGGDLEDGSAAELMRFANRVPLVYQRGACAMTDVVKGINWRNYGLDQPGGNGIPDGPVVIMVHVASTNVPFTSESKDAVANVPEIEDELELAVREAARDLKSHLNKRESRRKRREKQNVIADILPTMAAKVSAVTGRASVDVSDSLARIMNNVLVERTQEDGTVTLSVQNNGSKRATPEITAIVSEEPRNPTAGDIVEMEGEYFLTWEPEVDGGETATLEYEAPADAEFEIDVEGVDETRLTVTQ